MWRELWIDNVRIMLLGKTEQFRFVIKCGKSGKLKFYLYEGKQWCVSSPAEIDYYLTFIDSFDAIVYHHQVRRWVKTTTTIFRQSVLRN